MKQKTKMKARWSRGFAVLILLSAGCAKQDAAKDGTPAEDQGPAPVSDLGEPDAERFPDVSQTDSEIWTWDDTKLGQPCDSVYDGCGAGNICLANVTCLDICQRNEEENPLYYKCQRKCVADEHCIQPGQRCVARLVGDGETDVADLCVSVCLPADARNAISLEDCRSRQERSQFATWPPLP